MSRRRLGFIVPSVNAVFEIDCRRALPSPYDAYTARASCAHDDEDELSMLAARAPGAARDLRDAAVDAVAFACTSGSVLNGDRYDREIADEIAGAARVPATTSGMAVRQALRSLKATNAVLLTPYEDWLNARVVSYLEDAGVHVSAVSGFGMPDPREHERVEPAVIAERALSLSEAGTDAVVISCTSFRGMEAAELIRRESAVPVVSSNEATLWAAIRLLGEGSETFGPLSGGGDHSGEGGGNT